MIPPKKGPALKRRWKWRRRRTRFFKFFFQVLLYCVLFHCKTLQKSHFCLFNVSINPIPSLGKNGDHLSHGRDKSRPNPANIAPSKVGEWYFDTTVKPPTEGWGSSSSSSKPAGSSWLLMASSTRAFCWLRLSAFCRRLYRDVEISFTNFGRCNVGAAPGLSSLGAFSSLRSSARRFRWKSSSRKWRPQIRAVFTLILSCLLHTATHVFWSSISFGNVW